MKERNTNIEILRLLCMVAIFGWHILIHGYGLKNIEHMAVGGGNMFTFCALSSLFAPATYCFMFISGYYGLNFRVKKAVSLEMWLIITCFLVCILKLFMNYHLGVRDLITSFIPISSFKWWFMTYYVLVMFISPIINKGFESESKKMVSITLLTLIIYQFFSFVRLIPNGGSSFLGLLTVYLIGRYCNVYKFDISVNKAILLFVLFYVLQLSGMLLCGHYMQKILFRTLNYNTPFILMMSISLFYIFKGMTPRYSKRINYCIQPVLFIYLITEGLGGRFYRLIRDIIDDNFLMGASVFFIAIVSCLIVGRLIMWFTNMLIRFTITKWNYLYETKRFKY